MKRERSRSSCSSSTPRKKQAVEEEGSPGSANQDENARNDNEEEGQVTTALPINPTCSTNNTIAEAAAIPNSPMTEIKNTDTPNKNEVQASVEESNLVVPGRSRARKSRKKPKRLTLPRKYSKSTPKKKVAPPVLSRSRCAGKVLLNFRRRPRPMEDFPPSLPLEGGNNEENEVEERDGAPSEDDVAAIDFQEEAYFTAEGEDIFIDDENADGSDVENILSDYDSEGMPKEKSDEMVSRLPAGLHVARRRRFRNAYAPPSLIAQNLFTKFKGMTISLGKLDHERRLMSDLQKASDAFIGTNVDLSLVPTHETVDGTFDSVNVDIKKWLFGTPNLYLSQTTFPFDLALTTLIRIFANRFKKMQAFIPDASMRVNVFFNGILSTVKLLLDRLFDTMVHAVNLKCTISTWTFKIGDSILEKNTLIDYLSLYKQSLMAIPPEFDERSIRGLKPLRHTFIPPYFKDWTAKLASPSLFKKGPSTDVILSAASMKQKWTVKDVAELKSCILKSVTEKKLGEAKVLFDLMQERFRRLDSENQDNKIVAKINNPVDIEDKKRIGPKRGRRRGVTSGYSKKTNPKMVTFKNAAVYGAFPNALKHCANSDQVREWHRKEKDRIMKLKYDQIFDTNDETSEDINWQNVSSELMQRTKKLRLPDDCKKLFEHTANPKYNNKRRWSDEEKESLKKNTEWIGISNALPHRRTEFVIFYKWRKICNPPKKMEWDQKTIEVLRRVILMYNANWHKIPVELNDSSATKNKVQEKFKKSLNPILRFGKFTRVEDSLMLLTIQKLKGQFGREKHFGILTAYLPWRYESAWRDRAENLFAEYIVPWTLEEDRTLMSLATTMKRDWSKIAKKFNSFKTRKGCLTRFKILEKRLPEFSSLEHYHESYAMIRYNVQEYRHLKEIAILLKEIMKEKLYSEFTGLARDRPPTEDELQDMILAFDRDIMGATVTTIETYISKRDEYWNDWRKLNGVQPGEKKRTHDRRTFHPENTQSIASALHIRDVKLIPRGTLKFNLTQRESEIYKFYAQFCSTKPLKKDKPRPYIPMASTLAALPDVKRIILMDSVHDLPALAGSVPRSRKKASKAGVRKNAKPIRVKKKKV